MQPDYQANVYLLSTCNVTQFVGLFVIQIGAQKLHISVSPRRVLRGSGCKRRRSALQRAFSTVSEHMLHEETADRVRGKPGAVVVTGGRQKPNRNVLIHVQNKNKYIE